VARVRERVRVLFERGSFVLFDLAPLRAERELERERLDFAMPFGCIPRWELFARLLGLLFEDAPLLDLLVDFWLRAELEWLERFVLLAVGIIYKPS
jgi:hypothetical protein